MKLTWFGGTTLRVYLGGRIVVIDPEGAASGIDRRELLAGADEIVVLADTARPTVNADDWRIPVVRPLDPPPEMQIVSIAPNTVLIWAQGDPPLLVADVAELPHMGWWVDSAVFVLFGRQGVRLATDIAELELARPRLIALAAPEAEVDELFQYLVGRVDYAKTPNLAALEPGLALEV